MISPSNLRFSSVVAPDCCSLFTKFFILAVALLSVVIDGKADVIFSQDFNSSTTLGDYISATPNSGQWNAIGTSGAAVTVSVAGNNLAFSRTGNNLGSFSRTTDFSPIPLALTYQFSLSVAGNSAQTTAAVFQIGSGYGTANSPEDNADTYARFGVNLGATAGEFGLRDVSNTTSSSFFTGTQQILWVLNNSGSSIFYSDPNAVSTSLANDTADLWIGTTQFLNGAAIETASQNMANLKFSFTDGTGTIAMDNFVVKSIPEGTSAMLLAGAGAMLWILRRRRFF